MIKVRSFRSLNPSFVLLSILFVNFMCKKLKIGNFFIANLLIDIDSCLVIIKVKQ